MECDGNAESIPRGSLWVCTASHQQMMDFKESENGMTGIFKYDLRSKKLIRKYLLPAQPKPHWLGDLVLNSKGDVFARTASRPVSTSSIARATAWNCFWRMMLLLIRRAWFSVLTRSVCSWPTISRAFFRSMLNQGVSDSCAAAKHDNARFRRTVLSQR